MCSSNYRIIQKCFVVFAILVFVFSLIIAYLNTARIQGLFVSTNGIVDNKYYQEVSPSGTAFGIIWPIIYVWNAAAAIYIFISLFLQKNKSPVNFEPTLIPIKFLISYSCAFGGTLCWLFAFDREILGLALFLLLFSTGSLYLTLAISWKRVHDSLKLLETDETKVMLWCVRIIIQNGLGLPATWLTLATCINLTDVIIYQDSINLAVAIQRGIISIQDGSSAILAVLLVIIIVWFILDNFIFHEYTRYTFTIFPVFILGLSGLVAKLRYQSISTSNQNLIFASVILGFSCVALIARVVLFIYRCHGPRNEVRSQEQQTSEEKV